MSFRSLLVAGVIALQIGVSAQTKPTLVVQTFKNGPDVSLPYDLGLLQTQLVAELKVMLGKDFDVVAEAPANAAGKVYTLDGDITAWRAGNAAKRFLVGMGSGREALDLSYRVSDGQGKLFDRSDTIRTNFYSQGAGSTGTLAHPIAQKIGDRIKDAGLK
jgi:hypothetical protein